VCLSMHVFVCAGPPSFTQTHARYMIYTQICMHKPAHSQLYANVSLGAVGHAGISKAINFHQAYPYVHALHSFVRHNCMQCPK
jgi:hypothetical protein